MPSIYIEGMPKELRDKYIEKWEKPPSDIELWIESKRKMPKGKKEDVKAVAAKLPSDIELWIESEKRLAQHKPAVQHAPAEENKPGIAPVLAAAAALFLITQG